MQECGEAASAFRLNTRRVVDRTRSGT